jgi:[CysO sulfur-carrier protein]-S-L-cysteine hydrolase
MKIDQISIPLELWQEMEHHVRAEAPLEACGLIAGYGNRAGIIYPVTNTLKSPVRFRMDPYEQLQAFERIEETGLELVAIYHSHPTGPETPSLTDIDELRYDVPYLIWSPREGAWQARAFWLDKGNAAELGLELSGL